MGEALGVEAGYDMMKVSTTVVDVNNVQNKHAVTSLFVDNLELKGDINAELAMSATLYVDGASLLAPGEASGSLSGHNQSNSRYGLYVAGEDANNQILGKLYVK